MRMAFFFGHSQESESRIVKYFGADEKVFLTAEYSKPSFAKAPEDKICAKCAKSKCM